MAQSGYGLIKLDLNQVAFDQLTVKGVNNPKVGVKNPAAVGNPGGGKNDVPLSATDGIWIYGFFEVRRPPIQQPLDPGDKGSAAFRKMEHARWGKDVYFYLPEVGNIVFEYIKKGSPRDDFFKKNGGQDCRRQRPTGQLGLDPRPAQGLRQYDDDVP